LKVEALVQTLCFSHKVIKFYCWNGWGGSICHLAAKFALLVSGPTRRRRRIPIYISISISICMLHWQANINDYLLHSN